LTTFFTSKKEPVFATYCKGAHGSLGCISSLIVAVVLAFFHGFDVPSFHDIAVAAVTAIIFSTLLYFIWKSFYYTEPYVLGALSYILPVFLILAGWLMGEEPMNKITAIGTLVITLGALSTVLDSLSYHRKKIAALIRQSRFRFKNRRKN
jgi:drug/metabolite transporter (DMT)-like permease